ncbi:chemotaxis protein CheB [Methylocystis sp. B8]|uniref:chemotaxis protein CheB n=1 Tax=Methylocystis sp. B8 TaxID=544938 RepID=UPI0010FF5AAF|nr:chemotaxis protein CheB [Methylocystis sp. B8]TLG72651.1 PAS domain S-box protein [Methylocystis sp. B8]
MAAKKQAGRSGGLPKKPVRRTPAGAQGHASKPADVDHRAPHLIVGVGASAGGLEAFTKLLQHLPTHANMAFVLVQHLDPHHESALTNLLARATSMSVKEVTNGLRVERDCVYVIPPNANMVIAHGVLNLQPRQEMRGAHHSIDFFFQSLAQDLQERAIGVVLSGTASDGTLGLEAIKAEGGITFAQDDSARYDSMPRSAIAAGCVDFVLKPEDIAKELARIADHPFVAERPLASPEDDRAFAVAHEDDETPLPSGGHGAPATDIEQARGEGRAVRGKARDNGFRKILLLLRNHSGVDFSLYKSTTIQRRISRRMVLNRKDALEDYADFLRGNAKELDALYSDVLIRVTSFFRNPEAFDVLKRQVFPRFLQNSAGEPFRAWVLGCSTGQEAYSIAMAFVEAAEEAHSAHKIQIFATDVNDALLDKARQGLYAKSLTQDVSPERLRRFFIEEADGYRVDKRLREMIVFARQNFISDPPFSRMDLVSCRNLLIYLEPNLQHKLLPTFHYALKPEGFLFLGASESISGFADLFEPLDRKHKIYSRKGSPTPRVHPPAKKDRDEHKPRPQRPGIGVPLPTHEAQEEPDGFRAELNSLREADRVTVSKYAPPGVLVNADLQIIQFRGPTGTYLEPPTGNASFGVLKMARDGLMLPLRAAIDKAKKSNGVARKENIRLEQNGETRVVNVEVIPLKNLRERHFLILFDESQKRSVADSRKKSSGERPSQRSSKKEESRRVADLERELAETRDYLQFIQEQNEAANEELQASNEEVQSANEELQSINEELETSKEELESANEELTTINEEMASRNAELSRLNSDLVNFQIATHLAVVVVARDLTIRRFSAQAAKQFNLLAEDVGRPLAAIRHTLDLTDLAAFVGDVIASVREREQEVRDEGGCWHSLRVRPYLTLDNKVDGAVLVLVDIDALKQTQQDIAEARERAEAIIKTVPDPLILLHGDLRVHSANVAFYRAFGLSPAETAGRSIFEIDGGAWANSKLRQLLEDIIPRDNVFNDFELAPEFGRIGRRVLLLNARALRQTDGNPKLILLGMRDVTELVRLQAEMQQLAAIVKFSADAIISKDMNGAITSWNEGAERLFGFTAQEAVGQSVELVVPPEGINEEASLMERVRQGESVENQETVRRRKDGALVEISLSASPIRNVQGQVTGVAMVSRDITERKQAEEHVKLLLKEVNHRAKNMLGVVQVIARQTAVANPKDFIERFSERVSALAANHDLLVKNEWRGIELADLVHAQLAHFADLIGDRILLTGSSFRVSTAAAQALGMVLYELATNASKYGALSDGEGRVAIDWRLDADVFAMSWTERGGPPVAPPERKGYGYNVIVTLAKMALKGEVALDYDAAGIVWRVRCPSERVVDPGTFKANAVGKTQPVGG